MKRKLKVIVNYSTDINRTNNHLSNNHYILKNRPQYTKLEIQDLAWHIHKNEAVLNLFM